MHKKIRVLDEEKIYERKWGQNNRLKSVLKNTHPSLLILITVVSIHIIYVDLVHLLVN